MSKAAGKSNPAKRSGTDGICGTGFKGFKSGFGGLGVPQLFCVAGLSEGGGNWVIVQVVSVRWFS